MSVPESAHRLGLRSRIRVSSPHDFKINGPLPEAHPFALQYVAFCSGRPLVSPVTKKCRYWSYSSWKLFMVSSEVVVLSALLLLVWEVRLSWVSWGVLGLGGSNC